MGSEDLKHRTKAYTLRGMRLVAVLPSNRIVDVIAKQLVRSAASVGANYRAACRAKSPADFIAKMGIVEEEADESLYWMELLIEANFVPREKLADLMQQGNEIVAITISSIKTARNRKA